MDRRTFPLTAAALLALGLAGPVAAQPRPITLIVPYPPGGTTDRVARLVAAAATERLGQTVLVVNKPGAGGALGVAEVAKAAPDGLTLAFIQDSHITVDRAFKGLTFDPFKSFDYVSLLLTAPHVVVTSSKLPYRTLADLLAAARSAPNKISYAALGETSSNTLYAALLGERAGAQVLAVPYQGGGATSTTDLLEGRVDYVFSSVPAALPFIKSGGFRPLAFGGTERSTLLPDVPLLSDTFPGMTSGAWFGVIAPAGLGEAKQKELSSLFASILQSDATRRTLVAEGYVIQGWGPKEFLDKAREDSVRLGRLVRTTGDAPR